MTRAGIVSPAKRVELPSQNGDLILEIADDNFVFPTFPHYYGRNDEAADRQTRASLQFRAMERSSLQAGTSDTMRWTAIR
ncbi:hypothetical protein QUA54_29730 [Microcoleus sp. MOSTC5]|uniref:hypothetical protein n=1 Tax=Microcoleus sp. MOSTC5 TaxID=3055378 RepID=UPI002FD6B594